MFATDTLAPPSSKAHPATLGASAAFAVEPPRDGRVGQAIGDTLMLLRERLQPQRRIVHAGDVIYRAGEKFANLYILNTGFFKIVKLTPDGREQVVGLKLRGDWIGFDGIAGGSYGCEAIAMDTGELWVIRYDTLLATCVDCPELLTLLHGAMSRQLGRDRDSLMSVCTLPAGARVAEFLRSFAESLSDRGLRSDQITLRMTRAEIGNYLGMTLESVSRALSKMARENAISFAEKGRRDIRIPDIGALAAFAQRCIAPASALQ